MTELASKKYNLQIHYLNVFVKSASQMALATLGRHCFIIFILIK